MSATNTNPMNSENLHYSLENCSPCYNSYRQQHDHCENINLAAPSAAFMGAVAAAASYDHRRFTSAPYPAHLENYHHYNHPPLSYTACDIQAANNYHYHQLTSGTSTERPLPTYGNSAYTGYSQINSDRKSAFATVDGHDGPQFHRGEAAVGDDKKVADNFNYSSYVPTTTTAMDYYNWQVSPDLANSAVAIPASIESSVASHVIDTGGLCSNKNISSSVGQFALQTHPGLEYGDKNGSITSASKMYRYQNNYANQTNLPHRQSQVPTVRAYDTFQVSDNEHSGTVNASSAHIEKNTEVSNAAAFSECSVSPIPIDVTSVDNFDLEIDGEDLDAGDVDEFGNYSRQQHLRVGSNHSHITRDSLTSQSTPPVDVVASPGADAGSVQNSILSVGHTSPGALSDDDIECSSHAGTPVNAAANISHSIQMPMPVFPAPVADDSLRIQHREFSSPAYRITPSYNIYSNYFGYPGYNYLHWQTFGHRPTLVNDTSFIGSYDGYYHPSVSATSTTTVASLPSITILASQSAAVETSTASSFSQTLTNTQVTSCSTTINHPYQGNATVPSFSYMSLPRHYEQLLLHQPSPTIDYHNSSVNVEGDEPARQQQPVYSYDIDTGEQQQSSADYSHKVIHTRTHATAKDSEQNVPRLQPIRASPVLHQRSDSTDRSQDISLTDCAQPQQLVNSKESDPLRPTLSPFQFHGSANSAQFYHNSSARAKRPIFHTTKGKKKRKKTHPDKKTHPCTYCGMIFNYKTVLQNHERIHTGEKPYKCNQCGMAFARASYLSNHMRTHTGERPYQCKQCDSAFIQHSHLLAHEKIHTGERKHACGICNKLFVHAHNLKVHLAMHNGVKRYKCKECSVEVYSTTELKRHKVVHKNERTFFCSKCPKTFSSNALLRKHIPVHRTYTKLWRCQLCGQKFTDVCLLRNHKKMHHSSPKPYECELCKRSFAFLQTYQKHLISSSHLKHVMIQENKERKANEILELTGAAANVKRER